MSERLVVLIVIYVVVAIGMALLLIRYEARRHREPMWDVTIVYSVLWPIVLLLAAAVSLVYYPFLAWYRLCQRRAPK